MVREMRLELTRRLTHAPQTCLSTYSSTLASTLKAKAIIHMRGALVKKEFSSFSLAGFRQAFAQSAEKTDQREGKGGDQGSSAVVHEQEITHFEISVIAEQGSKLDEKRSREIHGYGERQDQSQKIGAVEIALMHMREQERDPDGEEETQRENRPVVQLLPVRQGDGQQIQHIEKGEDHGDGGRGLLVLDVGENCEDGRGIVVETAADAAGLAEIERDGLPERAAQAYRWQDQNQIGHGEDKNMLPVQLPVHQKDGVDREDEHGLQLEAEGNGGENHRGHGPAGQGTPDPQQERGDVETVTLAPDGAVQKNGREKQRDEKGRQQTGTAFGEAAAEQENAPGQQHVRERAEKLDEIEVVHGKQGEEREEI